MGWWEQLTGEDDAEPETDDPAAAAPSPDERDVHLGDLPGWRLADLPSTALGATRDALVSAAESSGLNDVLARFLSHPDPSTRVSRTGMPTEPGVSVSQAHALLPSADEAAERSPTASRIGAGAGLVLPALIPAAPEARAAQTAAREAPAYLPAAGRAVGEGAAYMGITSPGETPEEVARDAAAGALVSGGIHAGGHLLGRGARAVGGEFGRVASDADRARVASVLGERRAMLTNADMDELIRTLGHGDVARAAQRIRDSGVVGTFSTVDDIVQAANRGLTRAEGRTGAVRSAFEAGGHRVPVDTVPRALEQDASRMERDPAQARYADQLRAESGQLRTDLGRVATPGHGPGAISAAEQRLGELLGEREAIGQPSSVDELLRRLGAAEEQEGGLLAQGERGAVGRRRALIERDRASHSMLGDTPEERAQMGALAATSPEMPAVAETPQSMARTGRPSASRAVSGEGSPPPRLPLEDLPEPTAEATAARQDVHERLDRAFMDRQHAATDPATSLADAERALEPLRERSQYRMLTDVPAVRRVARSGLRAGRGAIDDVVESRLPELARGEFQAARGDVQTHRLIRDMAEERAQRAASRSPLASALGPILGGFAGGATAGTHGALVGGGGVGTAMALGAGYRALRAREASLLAAGAEGVQRLLQSHGAQALGRWGPQLEAAAARGRLPLVHEVLLRTDPEYRQALEAMPGPEEPAETEASTEPTVEPADDSAARRQAARRELARRELARRAAAQ